MDTAAAKSNPSAAYRAISWVFFVVFVALLGFGIVVYAQSSTHISGLAMAVIGILGIGALATSLRLARGRALGNRRPVYAGDRASAWNSGGAIHQHNQWFHNQGIWEQRRRDEEYHQQQHQQQLFHQQQRMWNNQ